MAQRLTFGVWLRCGMPHNVMLKSKALTWCVTLRRHLRKEVEALEAGMKLSYSMGSVFGDPGGCNSRPMLADRKEWARMLARLHELEEDLGTLDDEWWNGPKMKKPKEKDFQGLFRTPESIQRRFREETERWECEQRNEHWNRRKEAEAQRAHPKRRLRLIRTA